MEYGWPTLYREWTGKARKVWEWFQANANKTFDVEGFRHAMEFKSRDAHRWLACAEKIGMVKRIEGTTYMSTGTFIEEDGEACPFSHSR